MQYGDASLLESVRSTAEQQLREDGFAAATAAGNFADHVMYYVRGLVESRRFRLLDVVLYPDENNRRQVGRMNIKLRTDVLLPFGQMPSDMRNVAMQWCTSCRSLGLFEFPQYKQGTDQHAFVAAACIIAQYELLNFHPDVRNDPEHEHNRAPFVPLLSVDGAMFHVRDHTDNSCSSFYTSMTRGPQRLRAAGVARELIAAGFAAGIPLHVYLHHPSNSDGEIFWGYSYFAACEQGMVSAIVHRFLRDLPSSSYLRHDQAKLVSFLMTLHPRLGSLSNARFLNRDLIGSIVSRLERDHVQEFSTLLIAGNA